MSIPVPGFEPVWQPFMIWYLLIGIWCMTMLFGGLMLDLHRSHRSLPLWAMVLAVLAPLSIAHPYCWAAILFVLAKLWMTAPVGASLMATVLSVFSLLSFVYCFLGPDRWERLLAHRA